MPYNKVPLCQWCLAAASGNKAMLCWVLTGKHPIKLNNTNKYYVKDCVYSPVLSWGPEQVALPWKQVCGSTRSWAQMFLILLLLPPAQGYSKAKATFHFPLDKRVVQQSWETGKKREWRFYNCGADIAGDKGAASSGTTIFIARVVYIKEETQHGFQIDKAEFKNLAARAEIADSELMGGEKEEVNRKKGKKI